MIASIALDDALSLLHPRIPWDVFGTDKGYYPLRAGGDVCSVPNCAPSRSVAMSSSDGAADTPIIHKMNPRANKDSSGAIALLPFFDGGGAMLKAQARQSSIEDLTERNLAAAYLQWFASDQHLLTPPGRGLPR